MAISFTETFLGKIDPDTMASVNTLVNEVFGKPQTDRLSDSRTDNAFYVIACNEKLVVGVGGVETVPAFAGTDIPAKYFCDMAQFPQ